MKILAIETSCDETSAAVVEKSQGNYVIVHSNITSSSVDLHAATGGIIPERAAREQAKYMLPVIVEALTASTGENIPDLYEAKWEKASDILKNSIDAVAVTYGPGLIGSLLVGVEAAKTISFAYDKPLIPVNHLLGHLYANFIRTNDYKLDAKRYTLDALPTFPFIGLIVSGGHTDLLLYLSHTEYKWLGGTRDDAAGEALDKIGRLIGMSYPAGPEIEKRASKVNSSKFSFKSPMLHTDDLDFSFSGLKSEAQRFIHRHSETHAVRRRIPSASVNPLRSFGKLYTEPSRSVQDDKLQLDEQTKNEICFALQKAVFTVLIKKTLKAAEKYKAKSILLGGGVIANQTLINSFQSSIVNNNLSIKLFAATKSLCTDNAAMIGAYAAFHTEDNKPWEKVQANPELYFG